MEAESYSRIRSVKLKRATPEHPFGFSVRGGHEHGTGIFVSFVDPRSVAYRQGLKVGDQILRVNGYPVSAAVHHECLSLMRIRTSLHLKVRSVGMLPVREKQGDPLTWKLVEEPSPELPPDHNNRHLPLISRMSDTSSQPDSRTEFHGTEAKIYIDTSGHSGLGCCICKGPPERPGIFVQSTKSNGVAREAGLRPGDQILQCNGQSFLQIPFAEAVYYLKSSKHLNLLVLKGAASDLFPGESSGYNSSASSLNGDTHASSAGSSAAASESSASPHADIIVHDLEQANKRLSMVTEEIATGAEEREMERERLATKRNIALDRNIEWDEVEQVWRKAEKECIIIEVKGEDPRSRIQTEEERLAEERRKLEEEQRRLMDEAMRLEDEKRKFEEEKRRTLKKTPSAASSSSGSSESANSLAGALNQEILKRNERRENNQSQPPDERPKPGTVEQKKSLFTTPIDQEKRQQHEQLIEEFKRAHRKMFAHTLEEDSAGDKGGLQHREERESFRAKRIQKEIDHETKMVAQRVAGIVRQRQLRIERQHQECAETEREVSKHVVTNKSPPPPPPGVSIVDAHTRITGLSQRTTIKVQLPPSPDESESTPPASSSSDAKTHSSNAVSPSTTPAAIDQPKVNGLIPPPPTGSTSLPLFTSKTVIIEEKQSGSVKAASVSPDRARSQTSHKVPSPKPVQRPESPSPDYSNSPSPTHQSPTPPRQHRMRQKIGVDMESLESYRLKNPPKGSRQHPPFYFNDPTQRQVSEEKMVRICAYPSAYSRPEPSRLEFLDNRKSQRGDTLQMAGGKAEVILQKELEDALSKCNFAGRGGMAGDASQEILNNGNGKVTITLNNHNNHNNMNGSRAAHHKPNGGILKMSNGNSNGNSQKTISFGKF